MALKYKRIVRNISFYSFYIFYISASFYDLIWIENKKKLLEDKNIEAFFTPINSKINAFNRNKLFETAKAGLNKIYADIYLKLSPFLMLFVYNILFYFKETRKVLIILMTKVLEKFLFNRTEIEKNIIALKIYSFFFLGLVLKHLIPGFITGLSYSYKLGCVLCVCYLNMHFCISKDPRKYKVWLILLLAISLILCNILKVIWDDHRFLQQMNKADLNLIDKNLDDDVKRLFKDNIYHLQSNVTNMRNVFLFKSVSILLVGNWSNIPKKLVKSMLYHEIGHGGALYWNCFYLIRTILVVFSLFLYFKIIKCYSKNFEEDLFSNGTIQNFLLIINLKVFFEMKNIIEMCSSHFIEIFADRYAISKANSEDLIDALFACHSVNVISLLSPFFYCLFNSTHPSLETRVKLIQYFNKKD